MEVSHKLQVIEERLDEGYGEYEDAVWLWVRASGEGHDDVVRCAVWCWRKITRGRVDTP